MNVANVRRGQGPGHAQTSARGASKRGCNPVLTAPPPALLLPRPAACGRGRGCDREEAVLLPGLCQRGRVPGVGRRRSRVCGEPRQPRELDRSGGGGSGGRTRSGTVSTPPFAALCAASRTATCLGHLTHAPCCLDTLVDLHTRSWANPFQSRGCARPTVTCTRSPELPGAAAWGGGSTWPATWHKRPEGRDMPRGAMQRGGQQGRQGRRSSCVDIRRAGRRCRRERGQHSARQRPQGDQPVRASAGTKPPTVTGPRPQRASVPAPPGAPSLPGGGRGGAWPPRSQPAGARSLLSQPACPPLRWPASRRCWLPARGQTPSPTALHAPAPLPSRGPSSPVP